MNGGNNMATKGMTVFSHQGEDYTINDQNIAGEFSASVTYAKGKHVYYQGNLYRFTAAHAAGAWSGSDVEAIEIGEEVKNAIEIIEDIKTENYYVKSGTGVISFFEDSHVASGDKIAFILVNNANTNQMTVYGMYGETLDDGYDTLIAYYDKNSYETVVTASRNYNKINFYISSTSFIIAARLIRQNGTLDTIPDADTMKIYHANRATAQVHDRTYSSGDEIYFRVFNRSSDSVTFQLYGMYDAAGSGSDMLLAEMEPDTGIREVTLKRAYHHLQVAVAPYSSSYSDNYDFGIVKANKKSLIKDVYNLLYRDTYEIASTNGGSVEFLKYRGISKDEIINIKILAGTSTNITLYGYYGETINDGYDTLATGLYASNNPIRIKAGRNYHHIYAYSTGTGTSVGYYVEENSQVENDYDMRVYFSSKPTAQVHDCGFSQGESIYFRIKDSEAQGQQYQLYGIYTYNQNDGADLLLNFVSKEAGIQKVTLSRNYHHLQVAVQPWDAGFSTSYEFGIMRSSKANILDDIWRLTNKDTGSIGNDLYKAFKRVGVVGDSLSVGYMYNKSTETATARMLEYSWPKVVMKETGVPWLNLGTAGQNVLTWCSNATYGKVQAEAVGNKCQAYIIGLGENDQSDSDRGCPLGTPNDISDDYTQTATTYYGGYARIIEILKHLNPDCKIFCLTNPRSGENRDTYNEAVRYITETYFASDSSVILVDIAKDYPEMFNGSSFLPEDSVAVGGGHYSAQGYARIASIMEKAISGAMEDSYASMCNIAFISYDTGEPTANTMTE